MLWLVFSLVILACSVISTMAFPAGPPPIRFVSTATVVSDSKSPETSATFTTLAASSHTNTSTTTSHAARVVVPAIVASLLGVTFLVLVIFGYRRYLQNKTPQIKRLADEKGEHPQLNERRPYIPPLS